jgi:hypothetical protein
VSCYYCIFLSLHPHTPSFSKSFSVQYLLSLWLFLCHCISPSFQLPISSVVSNDPYFGHICCPFITHMQITYALHVCVFFCCSSSDRWHYHPIFFSCLPIQHNPEHFHPHTPALLLLFTVFPLSQTLSLSVHSFQLPISSIVLDDPCFVHLCCLTWPTCAPFITCALHVSPCLCHSQPHPHIPDHPKLTFLCLAFTLLLHPSSPPPLWTIHSLFPNLNIPPSCPHDFWLHQFWFVWPWVQFEMYIRSRVSFNMSVEFPSHFSPSLPVWTKTFELGLCWDVRILYLTRSLLSPSSNSNTHYLLVVIQHTQPSWLECSHNTSVTTAHDHSADPLSIHSRPSENSTPLLLQAWTNPLAAAQLRAPILLTPLCFKLDPNSFYFTPIRVLLDLFVSFLFFVSLWLYCFTERIYIRIHCIRTCFVALNWVTQLFSSFRLCALSRLLLLAHSWFFLCSTWLSARCLLHRRQLNCACLRLVFIGL